MRNVLYNKEKVNTACPEVAIIIVSWNQKKFTIECLKSLRYLEYPNYEVILVDNGSIDGTCEAVQKSFPEVNVISLKRNAGYGTACNLGMKKALEKQDVKYVYISNNDVSFHECFLNELVKVCETDSEIGIVGPIVYFYDKPSVIQGFGGHLNLRTGQVTHFRSYQIDTNSPGEIKETDFIIGGFLLIKKEVINRVGFFDPYYFMYGEETDYEYRAKKAGYKLVVVSTAKIWHKVYGSYGGKLSPGAVFYMARNQIYFMRKHMSSSVLLYFFSYQLMYRIPLTILAYMKNRRFCLLQAYLKGIVTGITNRVRYDSNLHKLSTD
jgi:GT2 family glycosyltransferase